LGKILANPNVGLKMQLQNLQLKVKVEVGLKFVTQHLGLSIFYPNLGSNSPALLRVYAFGRCFYSKQGIHFISACIFWEFNPMLGCFNPNLGQIWTNPAIELHF